MRVEGSVFRVEGEQAHLSFRFSGSRAGFAFWVWGSELRVQGPGLRVGGDLLAKDGVDLALPHPPRREAFLGGRWDEDTRV